MEQETPVQRLERRVTHPNSESIMMQRVPSRVAGEFRELANQEFCGDYGMLLKHVWESFLADKSSQGVLDDHERRIRALEVKKTQDEQPVDTAVRRMVDGTNRKVKA